MSCDYIYVIWSDAESQHYQSHQTVLATEHYMKHLKVYNTSYIVTNVLCYSQKDYIA